MRNYQRKLVIQVSEEAVKNLLIEDNEVVSTVPPPVQRTTEAPAEVSRVELAPVR